MPVLPVTRPYEKFAQAAKIFIDSGIIIVRAKFAIARGAIFRRMGDTGETARAGLSRPGR
jgi:hypothetical protein